LAEIRDPIGRFQSGEIELNVDSLAGDLDANAVTSRFPGLFLA